MPKECPFLGEEKKIITEGRTLPTPTSILKSE